MARWIEMPSDESDDRDEPKAAPRAPRIVFADDDPVQRQALGWLLRSDGFDVRAASSGEEVLELVAKEMPDVVILDLEMPGIDGFETCRRLQKLYSPPPPVLFLSAHSSVPHAVRGLDAGGMDFLGKPCDVDHLKAKVRRAARAKQSVDQLVEQVAHDPLTGLLSRAELDSRGPSMVALAERHRRALAALMIDVDRFKAINDEFGHPAGDEVLVTVANRVRAACRQTDHVFRLGGEEFLVLAPETPSAAAVQLGERLRWTVEKEPVKLQRLSGVRVRKRVCVSVGVSCWRPSLSLERLIAEADEALYGAKSGGRNRVCRYVEGMRGA